MPLLDAGAKVTQGHSGCRGCQHPNMMALSCHEHTLTPLWCHEPAAASAPHPAAFPTQSPSSPHPGHQLSS